MLLAIEHRYYGKSVLFNDYSTPNLRYLSSQQAVQDIGRFVVSFSANHTLRADTKWFTFGGSYPGMMSSFSRLKLPHLIFGSISSSAPVQAQVDYIGYLDVVAKSLSNSLVGGSQDCVNAITSGHKQIQQMLQSQNGRDTLSTKFNFCDSKTLNNKEHQIDWSGFGVIGINVQGNDPSCEYEYCNIEKVCDTMTNSTIGNVMDRLIYISSIQK
eukprot:UN34665